MNIITFAVLFFALVAVSLQDDSNVEALKKKMRENFQDCLQKTGVNRELTVKASKDNEFADDKKLKCFFKCLYENTGRMDSHGNLNMTAILNYLPSHIDKAKRIAGVDKCKNGKGADACETAFIAEDHKKKIHEFFDACTKESGVNPDLPKKALKDNDFADDKNLKCFFKCMMQKTGRMDSSGNMDWTKFQHVPPNVDPAKAAAAIDKCKATKGADPCDTAFLVMKCLRENMGTLPEHGH